MAVLADSVAALAVAAEPTELSKEATKEQAFLRWLEREGADVSKVVWPVRDAHGGRKAMAAVDVAADAAALAVPKALLMTPSAAEASDIGEYMVLLTMMIEATCQVSVMKLLILIMEVFSHGIIF